MKLRNAVYLACLCAFPPALAAQSAPGATLQSAAQPPDSSDPSRLPAWLHLNLEARGRAEWTLAADPDADGRAYLNRLRLNITAQPARWLRFHFEGQDARAFSLGSRLDVEPLRDGFDIRQAYVQTGIEEDGFQTRAGRQEFSVGDERLLGTDGDWDPLGQTFDGARLSYARPWGRVDAFAGYRVAPGARRPDPWDRASRIAGLVLQYRPGPRDTVIEPYLLWKRGATTLDLLARPGHRDVATPGLRTAGPLPHGFDFNIEMAFQRGHVAGDSIGAWAGHWEFGWRPFGEGAGPRVSFEYNHASGDPDPADGRHNTFDDLYPAGFNAHGIVDPFAWRNIDYPSWNIELPLSPRWSLAGAWRSYRLATVADGLYAGGDDYLARLDGARHTAIGSQGFVSTAFNASRRWRIQAGYGHLVQGDFLRQCACMSSSATLYLLTSYAF